MRERDCNAAANVLFRTILGLAVSATGWADLPDRNTSERKMTVLRGWIQYFSRASPASYRPRNIGSFYMLRCTPRSRCLARQYDAPICRGGTITR